LCALAIARMRLAIAAGIVTLSRRPFAGLAMY
jgi:hypothetical protein